MGLYPVVCQICKKPFLWFSGNVHQVCQACLDGKPVAIKTEVKEEEDDEQAFTD